MNRERSGTYNEVLRMLGEVLRGLGRIEGELVEIRQLSERVSKIEVWQSWLKGAWAVLVAGFAYVYRSFRCSA